MASTGRENTRFGKEVKLACAIIDRAHRCTHMVRDACPMLCQSNELRVRKRWIWAERRREEERERGEEWKRRREREREAEKERVREDFFPAFIWPDEDRACMHTHMYGKAGEGVVKRYFRGRSYSLGAKDPFEQVRMRRRKVPSRTSMDFYEAFNRAPSKKGLWYATQWSPYS
jgi:PAS domain-containing protein